MVWPVCLIGLQAVYDRVCKLIAVAKKEIDADSFGKEQFEAGVAQLDHAWKELSVRLLHWQSLLGMAVSFQEKTENVSKASKSSVKKCIPSIQ